MRTALLPEERRDGVDISDEDSADLRRGATASTFPMRTAQLPEERRDGVDISDEDSAVT